MHHNFSSLTHINIPNFKQRNSNITRKRNIPKQGQRNRTHNNNEITNTRTTTTTMCMEGIRTCSTNNHILKVEVPKRRFTLASSSSISSCFHCQWNFECTYVNSNVYLHLHFHLLKYKDIIQK